MFCPKCGTKLQDGSKMCMRCGSIINNLEPNYNQPNQNSEINVQNNYQNSNN